jgi:hypothetical protein
MLLENSHSASRFATRYFSLGHRIRRRRSWRLWRVATGRYGAVPGSAQSSYAGPVFRASTSGTAVISSLIASAPPFARFLGNPALLRNDSPLERDGFGLPVPSASHETVKPSWETGLLSRKRGADLARNRRFESISLQWGVMANRKPSELKTAEAAGPGPGLACLPQYGWNGSTTPSVSSRRIRIWIGHDGPASLGRGQLMIARALLATP